LTVEAHRVASYYRHLFHLPTFRGVILRWLLLLSFILSVSALVQTELALIRWPVGISLLAGSPWLIKFLDKNNILFTPRRGLFLQYVQFLFISGFLFIGLFAHRYLGQEKGVVVALLGLSSAMAFVMVVAAASFFDKIWQAFLFTLTQTGALGIIVMDPLQAALYIKAQPIFAAFTLIPIVTGVLFLVFLKKRGRRIFRQDPLTLLKYFLQAWSEGTPRNLEEWLEECSESTVVKSYIIRFTSRTSKLLWAIPGIHPGPFAPVGSYNLPARILDALQSQGKCVVFHGAAEHDANLPSQNQVNRFLQDLRQGGMIISDKGEFSGPIFNQQEGRRFSAFRIDRIAIVAVAYADEATDDLPTWMRERIIEIAQKIGYREAIVVDAHNTVSRQSHIENDLQRLLSDIEKALRHLLSQQGSRITVGVASSHTHNLNEDIGEAGISVTIIKGNSGPSAFVVIDSNNIQPEASRLIQSECQSLFGEAFMICTTDTHHNAAKVPGSRGYVLAGDMTPLRSIVDEIRSLKEKATAETEDVTVEVEAITSQLKTMGEDVLKRSFRGLSQLARLAKHVAYGLGLYTLLLLIAGFMM
jgi:putative membrane protein